MNQIRNFNAFEFLVKQTSKVRTNIDFSPDVTIFKNETVVKFSGKGFTALVSQDTGELRAIQLPDGKPEPVTQSWYYYPGPGSNNYIFKPNSTKPIKLNGDGKFKFNYGKEINEVQRSINSWVHVVTRVSKEKEYVEFDYVVGPIPMDDKIGKEIVAIYDTNLATKARYYTDANGRQMVERVRNYRPTFNYTITEPISGNYYPVNSRIALRDEEHDRQLTILTDRSQGGGSLNDGQLEIMVHRRLTCGGITLDERDVDGKGLVARGKHYLFFSKSKDAARKHRELGQ